MGEAIERNWEIPNFTIKEIRNAVPSHCFERNTFRSFTYLIRYVFLVATTVCAALYIDSILLSRATRLILWSVYWVAQGTISGGLWVFAHECGHQAFSSYKAINNGVGMVNHFFFNIPYHSWRISHSRHHKYTGLMSKDETFVPFTRSERGLPPKDANINQQQKNDENDSRALHYHEHEMSEQSPMRAFWSFVKVFVIGWPIYLIFGSHHHPGVNSHFNPYCALFEKRQVWDILRSDMAQFGSEIIMKLYLGPYLVLNVWIMIITYLQHTHPNVPHYRENSVDRSYGAIVDFLHHDLQRTHVAHHFFSTMPHYYTVEATHYIKKALGKSYLIEQTSIPIALWDSWTQCRFVEDEDDVVFFKKL
ncbi:fatty acid desaturase-domain-containing protein [Phascolomyces articulosus]|uniref:Fatty acid desaturase-domain-containing protein n=1 Tax=Phascolomyces articulosus TaxID=60185 RepID=A0AAD5JZM1_9FUNG|nr:fatty acid desaturase-domain-containing protein [Phascolomyces articulosus]